MVNAHSKGVIWIWVRGWENCRGHQRTNDTIIDINSNLVTLQTNVILQIVDIGNRTALFHFQTRLSEGIVLQQHANTDWHVTYGKLVPRVREYYPLNVQFIEHNLLYTANIPQLSYTALKSGLWWPRQFSQPRTQIHITPFECAFTISHGQTQLNFNWFLGQISPLFLGI